MSRTWYACLRILVYAPTMNNSKWVSFIGLFHRSLFTETHFFSHTYACFNAWLLVFGSAIIYGTWVFFTGLFSRVCVSFHVNSSVLMRGYLCSAQGWRIVKLSSCGSLFTWIRFFSHINVCFVATRLQPHTHTHAHTHTPAIFESIWVIFMGLFLHTNVFFHIGLFLHM